VNIYDFFDSPDIAAHCQSIGHEFSPLDMAVIIDRSSKPVKEKYAAYRAIIDDYPDMSIHESLNFDARDSLHDYLRELIAWEEDLIDDYYSTEEDALYRTCVYVNTKAGYHDSDFIYSTPGKAWEAVQKDWDWVEDCVQYVAINKISIDQEEYTQAKFNTDEELISFWSYKSREAKTPDELRLIFIHIPVPFKRGDLVMIGDRKPCVLDDIPHWWTGKRPYKDYISGKHGDGSDMCATMYTISEIGTLLRDHGPMFCLTELRYYDGKLAGQERFLRYLSQYIKTGAESIDWLVNVFLKFKAEDEYDELSRLFGGLYRELEREDS